MSTAPAPFDRPLDSLTYEEARDELVAIVSRLEAGAATLDESLGLWERGEALASRCEELLDGARARIGERGEGPAGAAGDDTDAGVIGIVPSDDED